MLRRKIGETLLRVAGVGLNAVKLPARAAMIAARENRVETAQWGKLLPGAAPKQRHHRTDQCSQMSGAGIGRNHQINEILKLAERGSKIAAALHDGRMIAQGVRQGFLQDSKTAGLRRTADEGNMRTMLVKTLGEVQPVTEGPAIQAESRGNA